MRAPLQDPLSYPGARPAASFLLRGAAVEPLPAVLPTNGRRAVLAIGSNASPAQLAAKFRGRRCSDTLLGLIVSVPGLQVRPSAHFSRSGYWPFAPVALDGSRSTAVLCLLDDDQLAVLDSTEPNYVRTRLDPAAHPIAGAPMAVGPAEVYVSQHGVVDDPRLPAWSDPPPAQHALLDALLRELPAPLNEHDPAGLSAAVRARPALADEITAAIPRRLRVRGSSISTVDRPR